MIDYKKILLTLLVAAAFSSKAEGLIIIANTDNENIKVEKRQVRDIFMGNNSHFSLKPVALSPSSTARFTFNTKIVGLTESRIQSYWTQMRFSGRKRPPQEFDSIEQLISHVQSTKNAVAYVPSETEIPNNLTVIYQID